MAVTGGSVIDITSPAALAQWQLCVVSPGVGYTELEATGIEDQSEDGRIILRLLFPPHDVETGYTAFLSFIPSHDSVVGPDGGPCTGIGVQQLPVPPGAIVAGFSDQF